MECEDKMHTHVHGGRIGYDSEKETAGRLSLRTVSIGKVIFKPSVARVGGSFVMEMNKGC